MEEPLRRLLKQGLFESAYLFALNLTTGDRSKQQLPGKLSEHLIFLGDALTGLQHHNRAIAAYESALEHAKGLFSKLALAKLEQEVKPKIAASLTQLGDTSEAIRTLESLAENLRSASDWTILAKSYEQAGNAIAAGKAYEQVLKLEPFAVEAALSLAKLSASTTTSTSASLDLICASLPSPSATLREVGWVRKYVRGKHQFYHSQHEHALQSFTELTSECPRNAEFWVARAQVQSQFMDMDLVRDTLQHVRSLDARVVSEMDTLAWALRRSGRVRELSGLALDFSTSGHHNKNVETYTIAALDADMRGKKELSMRCVDHALSLSSSPASLSSSLSRSTITALNVKGYLSLAHATHAMMKEKEEAEDEENSNTNNEKSKILLHNAITHLLKAYCMDKANVVTVCWLVDAYLLARKCSEALGIAKTALARSPRNPRILTLIGVVLGESSTQGSSAESLENEKKAIRVFEKALLIDPRCTEALVCLARLTAKAGGVTTDASLANALNVFQAHLPNNNKDYIHVKMAELCFQQKRLEAGMNHLHQALALNRHCSAAQNLLDSIRLTRQQDLDTTVESAEASPTGTPQAPQAPGGGGGGGGGGVQASAQGAVPRTQARGGGVGGVGGVGGGGGGRAPAAPVRERARARQRGSTRAPLFGGEEDEAASGEDSGSRSRGGALSMSLEGDEDDNDNDNDTSLPEVHQQESNDNSVDNDNDNGGEGEDDEEVLAQVRVAQLRAVASGNNALSPEEYQDILNALRTARR